MKQTLITRLILGAFAGLAAVGAYAGQIQSSSTSIAREAIQNDAQQIASPSIAYRFAGDIDARANDQTFQVQFTLNPASNGFTPSWGPNLVGGGANSTLAQAITITDGVTANLLAQATTMGGTDGDYTVLAAGISPNGKTVWATIKVWMAPTANNIAVPTALIKQPLITLNATSNQIGGGLPTNTSLLRNTVTGLFSVVGDIVTTYNTALPPTAGHVCAETITDGISFKHYTAVTDPMLMVGPGNSGNEDESQRSGATNLQGGWLVFPTNVGFNIAPPATENAGLTTGGNLTFTDTTGAGAGAGLTYQTPTTATLGQFNLKQTGAGLDSDLATLYNVAAATDSSPTTLQDGTIEVDNLQVRVFASQGFVAGGTISLDTSATCSTAGGVGGVSWASTVAGASPLTVTVPLGNVLAALGGVSPSTPVYVCYNVPGTAYIPSSQFTAEARVVKGTPAGAFAEQDDICNGPLTALGGSIKIDVRNYVSSADVSSGWQSTIRLINTSETKAADIQVQLINQDGSYGNWTDLATLAPLSVKNYSAASLDAALAAGTITQAGARAGTVSLPIAAATAGSSPRLRFTSKQGDTLRIQNYVQGPGGMIFEASNAEGVDFAGNITRAPASEGQYQTQDAQKGIDGK